MAGEGEGREEFEEELANLVTGGGLQPTRSYVNRRLNVYYSALRAFGELGNIEVGGYDKREFSIPFYLCVSLKVCLRELVCPV